jgi:hypothetical protein
MTEKKKQTFRVPVSWEVCGEYFCEAESWDDAIEQAEQGDLPTNGSYVGASFEVNHDLIEALREDEEGDV